MARALPHIPLRVPAAAPSRAAGAARRAMRVHVHSPLEFLEAIHRAHPDYFEAD